MNDKNKHAVALGKMGGVSTSSKKGKLLKETESLVEGLRKRFNQTYWIDSSGCWIWILGGHPYGRVSIPGGCGVYVSSHRLSFYLSGRDPGNMDVCHSCDVELCVNPDHLFSGTAKQNIQDMIVKGRYYQINKPHLIRKGEQINTNVLTESDVNVAIDRIKSGHKLKEIASDLGVEWTTISKIKIGKNWKHITGGRIVINAQE